MLCLEQEHTVQSYDAARQCLTCLVSEPVSCICPTLIVSPTDVPLFPVTAAVMVVVLHSVCCFHVLVSLLPIVIDLVLSCMVVVTPADPDSLN